MKNKSKMFTQLIAAIILVVVGCVLLVFGFIVPPLGVIDSSVLVAFGETCTFAGALFVDEPNSSLFDAIGDFFTVFREKYPKKKATPSGAAPGP